MKQHLNLMANCHELLSLHSESSPLVLAVTHHQELLLSSLSEVVAFLQGQKVAAVLEKEEDGKHTAYLALAQNTLNTAEVRRTNIISTASFHFSVAS